MSINQLREEVVSLLQEIDHNEGDSPTSLQALTYTANSSRLSKDAVKRLYEILIDSAHNSTWGLSAEQIRDRLRLNALDSHGYDDPFNGKPLRENELTTCIDQLNHYQKADT